MLTKMKMIMITIWMVTKVTRWTSMSNTWTKRSRTVYQWVFTMGQSTMG